MIPSERDGGGSDAAVYQRGLVIDSQHVGGWEGGVNSISKGIGD